ncbi:hypothetical protein Hypma_011511 [Hypsizygus marmoreus]|uniref:MARVEL domain-containing protein n=1 Tax=Hypsizygus marmoreus TaxID=39966 RepID=A0A369JPG2_HYPMA|nr:hypothetical protein Hypma_011511 [Hypsizygus marmoreus]
MSSRVWTIFRTIRVVIFALSTLLSLAWAIIFATLLLREWATYSISQRAVVIMALSINGVSALLLYLMIVVRFRLWLDAARIAFVLFFQLGSTITFALCSPSFPCNNLGSEEDCKRVTLTAINGGLGLSGLLLVYAFYLAVMSYVPPPPPPWNPESVLSDGKRSHSAAPSTESATWLLKPESVKRASSDSAYTHSTFIQSYHRSLDRSPSASLKSPSLNSERQFGVHRSGSRASFYSSASSSMPSAHGTRITASTSFLPRKYAHPSLQQLLPNPFLDPLSRHPSPMSEASVSTSQSDGLIYDARHRPRLLPPSRAMSLTGVGQHNKAFPPPPYMDRGYGAVSPHRTHLTVPSTPMSLRPSVQRNPLPREFTASPTSVSVRSMAASLHTPSRSGSYSVSPVSGPIFRGSPGLPASPRRVALSPTPNAHFNDISRYGTQVLNERPGIPFRPIAVSQATGRVRQEHTDARPEWVAQKTDRTMDFKQWRQDVLQAAGRDA